MRIVFVIFAAFVASVAVGEAAAAGVEVEIRGLDGDERANVELRLGILAYAAESESDEAQIRRLHRKAPDEIQTALQAFGYYQTRVNATLRGEPPSLVARYEVELGPPTTIETVRVEVSGEGADASRLLEMVNAVPLKEGERIKHAEYDNFKTGLLRSAYQIGFLDAVYTAHELRIDSARQRAQVTLLLETGPRYYFGTVTIEQDVLDEQFLRRYVPIKPGDPFNSQTLLDSQFALSDLGYFGQVEVLPQRDAMEAGNRIPIRIATTERPPGRYEFGLGYGTDTGPRASVGAEFRRLTTTGHKLRTDLRVSEIKKVVGAEYRIPLGTQAAENIGITGGYTDQLIGDTDTFQYKVGVYLARSPGAWQRRTYLNYSLDRSYLETGTDTATLLTPGLSLSRGESDDPIHTRLGWFIFFDVHGAHDDALSSSTFVQARTQIRGALPLGQRGRLLARTEIGGNFVDEFSSLPLSERFFAGGDQSVRGYSYQSLGPRDSEGNVIGGKYLSTYSLEAEMRIAKSWGAAIFADAGNADDKPLRNLFVGVGVGARYRAPVGTVQLDFAHPLEGQRRGIRLHIGIRVGL